MSAAAEEKIRFPSTSEFFTELKRRVNAHFEQTGTPQRDSPKMYLKTAVILAWLVGSYLLLMTVATTWWQVVLFALSLGLAMAGIGFDIQHDANHGGYSERKGVNRLLSYTLDLIGGSSYVWHWKHNVIHHTYANIAGVDADTDVGPFARLAPGHPHRSGHRFQHLYIWALYGLLPPKWHFIDDFKDVATGHIGTQRFPRPPAGELALLIGFKVFFYAWALVIPMLLHPVGAVLLAYGVASLSLGVVLAVTFQLAHCVSEASFPLPDPATHRMDVEWAVHQVNTTVDFARGSRTLTWFLGGLNFQVEHHLFPKISHVHYPEVSRIVEQTCADFGVRYQAHETLGGAIASHARWLRTMGRAPSTVAVQAPVAA